MSCMNCGQDLCVCASVSTKQDFPVPYRKYESAPIGITKEEFGLNLYQAIVTIGGLLGVEQHRASAIHQGQASKIPALIVRREQLQHSLAKQLPLLTNDEMDQILMKYPWVVGV